MNLTRVAIQKDRITWVALAVIAFAGVSTFLEMPRAEDPGFTVRTALVLTRFPGASAQRVEQLVTDKIEKKIQELPELDHIQSQSKEGVSLIYVDIAEKYKDMRPIWDNLASVSNDWQSLSRAGRKPSSPKSLSPVCFLALDNKN